MEEPKWQRKGKGKKEEKGEEWMRRREETQKGNNGMNRKKERERKVMTAVRWRNEKGKMKEGMMKK